MNPLTNNYEKNNSPRRPALWMWILGWFVLTGCGLFTSDNIWLSPFDDEPKSATKLAADSLVFEGIGYYKVGDFEKALESFMQAKEIDPDDPSTHYHIGLMYRELGQYEHAILNYDKAIELDPSYALAYYGRGYVQYELGQYDLAIVDFSKSIELDPTDADTYYNRGLNYIFLGENAKSVTDLKQTIILDPSYEYAYWGLGNAYYSLGRNDLALENFDKYIELAGDSADAGVIEFADSLRG